MLEVVYRMMTQKNAWRARARTPGPVAMLMIRCAQYTCNTTVTVTVWETTDNRYERQQRRLNGTIVAKIPIE